MKRYFAATLLLLPMLLTGCYDKWDYGGCPIPDNFELRFRLTDAGGGDLFAGKINNIDVVVFDEQGGFVLHEPITRNDLGSENSIRLTVDPGTYYVVAWANIGPNATLSPMGEGATFSNSYVEGTSPETCCPFYYAPSHTEKTRGLAPGADHTDYMVVLPPGEEVTKELNFVRAHRTVNVFIQGIGNLAEYDGEQPEVLMNNMPCKYDFYQNARPDRRTYTRRTETVNVENVGQMLKTSFMMPISAIEDDMTLNLRNSTDGTELIDMIFLKEWIEQNRPEYLNEFDMLIKITKPGKDVNVTVTIPNWNNTNVKPGDL